MRIFKSCKDIVTSIIILLIAISLIIGFHYLTDMKYDELCDIIGIVIAVSALLVAYKEYLGHKQNSKIEVFSKLNKVFVTDKNIQSVILYLNQKDSKVEPTVNEIELFFRFFEEIDVYLEQGLLDIKVADELFAFYCMEFFKDNPSEDYRRLLDKIEYDKYENTWSHLQSFIQRIKGFRRKDEESN